MPKNNKPRWIRNWFSNFIPFTVELNYEGQLYPSPEHFYQAMKSLDPTVRLAIASCSTPGKAKRMGRKVELRPNWATKKEIYMEIALRFRIATDPDWVEKLLNEDEIIVERNNWHDNEWGRCVCTRCEDKPHANKLGKLLMRLRSEITQDKQT